MYKSVCQQLHAGLQEQSRQQ